MISLLDNGISQYMAEKPLTPLAHELLPKPYDKAEMQAELPYAGFRPGDLTTQQEKFVHLVVSGMPVGAAGTAVGITPQAAYNWHKQDKIVAAIEHFRGKNREKLDFGIEKAHTMLMEAWSNCKDATEQVSVVRELVKLHGVAVAPKPQEVNINIQGPKQLERASDAQLLEAAGMSVDSLLPKRSRAKEPIVDAEFTEISATADKTNPSATADKTQ